MIIYHLNDKATAGTPSFFSSFFQETVELKQVDDISDTDEYLSLDGHGRAASLPRLNAEYHVRAC